MEFFRASSLKQVCGEIDMSKCCLFSGEAANTNFIFYGLTWLGLKPLIYLIQVEHDNHYITNAVLFLMRTKLTSFQSNEKWCFFLQYSTLLVTFTKKNWWIVGFPSQWLVTGRWFSPGSPVSSTNKTYHHDITEILLKHHLPNQKINFEGMIYERSSKIPHFILIGQKTWLPHTITFLIGRYTKKKSSLKQLSQFYWPNFQEWCLVRKILFSFWSNKKHDHHRQFLILIGQYTSRSSHLKILCHLNQTLREWCLECHHKNLSFHLIG